MVELYTQEELGGFIPVGSRVVWWSSPQYGGLPTGAIYRSVGPFTVKDLETDVAIFESDGSFWTIDLWTDEIIRVHKPKGEAPDRQLHSRTLHQQASPTDKTYAAYLTRYGGGKGSI
jgi:hypothetical protein|tara:strand:- start:2422 stop:2772 length:351 start_codon:yes stop_codon:yes gene_type:complete